MLDLKNLLEQRSGYVMSVYSQDTVTPPPFAFILNLSELADSAAVVGVAGRTLRRASNDEIKFTKEIIESLFGRHFSSGLWEEQRPASGSGKYTTLPAEQWRYFVIEFDGSERELKLLEESLSITPNDLEIGFALSTTTLESLTLPICVYRPPQLFQSLSALNSALYSSEGSGKAFSNADGEQTGKIYDRLLTHDHNVLDLNRVFELFFELKDLPRFSPLQVLGYFAILESILTHQPREDDRYDSITRQVTQKLALLNKRWPKPLDYSCFGGISHDNLWPKMYAYRSAIAHGTKPDFGSKLSALRSAKNANSLIKEAVKQTVCQALIEPQLIADLHNC